MIRKPTSGDSQQREREAERARKASQLAAVSTPEPTANSQADNQPRRPQHGSSDGESAHGAIPRKEIEGD